VKKISKQLVASRDGIRRRFIITSYVLSFAIAQKKEPKKRLGSHTQLFPDFGIICSLTIF
jgi:hypothetical protein